MDINADMRPEVFELLRSNHVPQEQPSGAILCAFDSTVWPCNIRLAIEAVENERAKYEMDLYAAIWKGTPLPFGPKGE